MQKSLSLCKKIAESLVLSTIRRIFAPKEIKEMPLCYERVENVRNVRLASTSAGTRKLADTPTQFHVENMLSQQGHLPT